VAAGIEKVKTDKKMNKKIIEGMAKKYFEYFIFNIFRLFFLF
jgi:hypothetical protein